MGNGFSSPSTRADGPVIVGAPKRGDASAKKVGAGTRAGIQAKVDRIVDKVNQDRGLVAWPLRGSSSQALFGIFDGHGKSGELISSYCQRSIVGMLMSDEAKLRADPAEHLRTRIIEMDKRLNQHSALHRAAEFSGTTCTVVYIRGSTCWVAASGDSRAVMGRASKSGLTSAIDLSIDHKPDNLMEKERILKAGGEVCQVEGNDVQRVWAPEWAFGGRGSGLAMSRSIGDFNKRQWGCIPDPDVARFDLSTDEVNCDNFIIIASDGVWEYISSYEACEMVMRFKEASEAAEVLIREAKNRWKQRSSGNRDDITAIVVRLPLGNQKHKNREVPAHVPVPARAVAPAPPPDESDESDEDEDNDDNQTINVSFSFTSKASTDKDDSQHKSILNNGSQHGGSFKQEKKSIGKPSASSGDGPKNSPAGVPPAGERTFNWKTWSWSETPPKIGGQA